ncbi:MAG: D-alanyl-D-alanine carboxypeptidase family protein [Clostridia bacterium]
MVYCQIENKFKAFILTALLSLTIVAVSLTTFTSGNVAYATSSGFNSTAKSAYLVDDLSGSVIFAKNENARLPIASMMKIMTTLLTFEAIDSGKLSLDEEIEISEIAANMGGSQVFLDANSKHKVSNLIKSVIVASANDSSVALAEKIGGSVSGFVDMMNSRAKQLKMDNTHFVNCTGLPAPESFSSAKDASIMFRELIQHSGYFNYSKIWLEEYPHPSGRTTTITNTNKLVRFYKGCDGGKTGFTNEAKFCLTATAKRDDMRLVGVVIGADSSKSRFSDVSEMFNTAFNNYTNKSLVRAGESVKNNIEVVGGKKNTIDITVDKHLSAFMAKNEGAKFEVKFELPTTIKAKISVGDIIGKAYLVKDGVVTDEANVVANETVLHSSVFDEIKRIGDNWCDYQIKK